MTHFPYTEILHEMVYGDRSTHNLIICEPQDEAEIRVGVFMYLALKPKPVRKTHIILMPSYMKINLICVGQRKTDLLLIRTDDLRGLIGSRIDGYLSYPSSMEKEKVFRQTVLPILMQEGQIKAT